MTIEKQTTVVIPVDLLLDEVKKMHDAKYRLVQVGCGQFKDQIEINYSFERDLVFSNLRITIDKETQVPSVTDLYHAAFVYENEIHDLFGIGFFGISLDYQGTFIRTKDKHPFYNTINKEDSLRPEEEGS
ncbi:MAG: NADH-quinone oxidoreductase subunit C [Methanospirillaceae archaeon]|nr:NADH-quinone oxidoreductase subunit C [Methanospirillaceae archaeon]